MTPKSPLEINWPLVHKPTSLHSSILKDTKFPLTWLSLGKNYFVFPKLTLHNRSHNNPHHNDIISRYIYFPFQRMQWPECADQFFFNWSLHRIIDELIGIYLYLSKYACRVMPKICDSNGPFAIISKRLQPWLIIFFQATFWESPSSTWKILFLKWKVFRLLVLLEVECMCYFSSCPVCMLASGAALASRTRVRSCVSSPFSRCTPILDWSE